MGVLELRHRDVVQGQGVVRSVGYHHAAVPVVVGGGERGGGRRE